MILEPTLFFRIFSFDSKYETVARFARSQSQHRKASVASLFPLFYISSNPSRFANIMILEPTLFCSSDSKYENVARYARSLKIDFVF